MRYCDGVMLNLGYKGREERGNLNMKSNPWLTPKVLLITSEALQDFQLCLCQGPYHIRDGATWLSSGGPRPTFREAGVDVLLQEKRTRTVIEKFPDTSSKECPSSQPFPAGSSLVPGACPGPETQRRWPSRWQNSKQTVSRMKPFQ